ncbi:MAG: aldehyde dehydrogenase family protein [Actinobacteria bacterium]|nr:aldehyde dehydrogenase family protein [Actinomycetota bacterium]MBU1866680.1 aldehyde dehydrogenase family protein [Actinomycetota bacterium]
MTAAGRTQQEPTSTFQIDRSLQTLAGRAAAWSQLPLAARIEHLRTILRRTAEVGPDLVRAAGAAKGGGFEGEDWVGGVAIQGRTVRALLATLEGIGSGGRVPIDAADVSVRPDGRVVVEVTPMDRWDRLLFPGWRGEIWMEEGVSLDDLDANLGSFYTKGGVSRPGVAAVLGAGNVASITPLDALHMLFVEGKATIVKFNPVNDYIGPYFERVFGDLIEKGFVRCCYGGAEVGAYLVSHPMVDQVHVTGSAATHDAIVFGPGSEGAAAKARHEPRLTKTITSELGNVSPVIVVPGEWKERDLRFQAEHLATQMKQNEGFNCNAAKVIVLHEGWGQKEAFLAALRRELGALAGRPAYYPGAFERWESFVASHPDVEFLGPIGDGIIPATLLVGLDPSAHHLAFSQESFCAVSATTELGGDDAAEFLGRAVAFCNERLDGTLNATIIIDPVTAAEAGEAVDAAVDGLRYGAIGVNIWGGALYALGTTVWGGYPGAALADIGSGIGFVHNGRLVDHPQKSVVWAPFRQFPKPPWFVTHRNTNTAMRRFAEFETDPGPLTLARVALASLRG